MSNTPQTGSTNALKRSVDAMQCVFLFFLRVRVLFNVCDPVRLRAGSGSSTRPPIQGMGLAQRQQNAIARRPSDGGEGSDLKRLKR